jgi:hypothetical protein
MVLLTLELGADLDSRKGNADIMLFRGREQRFAAGNVRMIGYADAGYSPRCRADDILWRHPAVRVRGVDMEVVSRHLNYLTEEED